jgi:hypothetical protein
MELIHLFISPFYFKFSFVLFLFILNMYFIFTHKKEESLANKETPILQSGFGNRNLKGLLNNLVLLGGFLSSIITLKNEFKSVQIGKLDQLMEADRDEIRKSIDRDREGHQNILTSIENSKEELLKLNLEKANLVGQNDKLLSLHNSIQNKVSIFQEKSIDPDTKLSELGILDQLIKQDTSKFGEELDSLILNIGNPLDPLVGVSSSPSPKREEGDTLENLKDLKESGVLDFNLFTNLDWFESLNGIKKLAVCLILGKSMIFSALLSIVFVFYGNILIEKYDIENKYPKLAKLIQLRQKYQKYYFNYYCFLIISVILIEIAFAVAILTL